MIARRLALSLVASCFVLAGVAATDVHADPPKPIPVAKATAKPKTVMKAHPARPAALSAALINAAKTDVTVHAKKPPPKQSNGAALIRFDLSAPTGLTSGQSFLYFENVQFVEGGPNGCAGVPSASSIDQSKSNVYAVFHGLKVGEFYLLDVTCHLPEAPQPVFGTVLTDAGSSPEVTLSQAIGSQTLTDHAVFAFEATAATTTVALRSAGLFYLYGLDLHTMD